MMLKKSAKVFLLFVVIVLWPGLNEAGEYADNSASNLIGEFASERLICWEVEYDNPLFPHYTLQFRVNRTGRDYYILQSTFQKEGDVEASLGSAQIVQDQVIMTMNSTHSDNGPDPINDADSIHCQYFLDTMTLNGTGWCMHFFYNPPPVDEFGFDYGRATLTYTECPEEENE